jgi:hypothetical protein
MTPRLPTRPIDTVGRRPRLCSRGARRRPGAPQTAPRTRASAWTPAARRANLQLSAAPRRDHAGTRVRVSEEMHDTPSAARRCVTGAP